MRFTMEDALYQLTTEKLKQLIFKFCPAEKPARKADMVAVLKPRLLDAKKLHAAWGKLDDIQKLAVSEALYSERRSLDDDFFEAKYKSLPGFSGNTWKNRKSPDSPLVIFFCAERIPDDLKELLLPLVGEPPKAEVQSSIDPPIIYQKILKHYTWQEGDSGIAILRRGSMFQIPRQKPEETIEILEIQVTACDTAMNAQHDLKKVLQLIELGKVTVSDKTMRPSTSSMRGVAASLTEGDYYQENSDIGFVRSFAWPMLLQAGGLVEGGLKTLQLTKAGIKAISSPSTETLKLLWDRWMLTRWDEFQRINFVKGQNGKDAGMTMPSARRATIIDGLSKCPTNRWVDVSEFSRYLQANKSYFDVTHEPWNLYIGQLDYGSLGYDDSHKWNIFQERYIKCFFLEYAATLGLLDVAYVNPGDVTRDFAYLWGTDDLPFFSRYDGLLSFKINDFGAYCLGLSPKFQNSIQKSTARIAVTSNLRITVTDSSVSADVSSLLDTYAERESHSSWRLDLSKAAAAVERGHQISDLENFLKSHDEQPLPQTVESFVTKVRQNSTALKDIGSAILIECVNENVAHEIATTNCTKHLCQLLNKRTLVVRKKELEQFRKAVNLLGFGML